jgi:hypothetical protein
MAVSALSGMGEFEDRELRSLEELRSRCLGIGRGDWPVEADAVGRLINTAPPPGTILALLDRIAELENVVANIGALNAIARGQRDARTLAALKASRDALSVLAPAKLTIDFRVLDEAIAALSASREAAVLPLSQGI